MRPETSWPRDGVVLVLGIPDLGQGLASAQCADFGSAPSTFRYASRKDWETLARDLRPAYSAATTTDSAEARHSNAWLREPRLEASR